VTTYRSQTDLQGPRTIPAVLDRAAETYGERPFLVADGEVLSFAGTRRRAREAAAAFVGSGLEPGDRVAVWAPNSVAWIIACLGLQYAGGVLVPVNTRYRGDEAAYVVARSRARMLVTCTDFLDVDYVGLLRGSEIATPELTDIVVLSGAAPDGCVSWSSFLERAEPVPATDVDARARAVGPDDLCDIVFTSGTTGSPKGVMLAHGQTTRILEVWNEMLGLIAGDRYLVLNPFFHVFGYKYGWLCSLMAGVTVYPTAVFAPEEMLAMAERERITVIPGQPTVFQALIDAQARTPRDLSGLRLAIIGSTSIPPQVVHEMYDVLGFEHVVSGYGLTESSGELTLCRFDDDAETVASTVGRVLPGVELSIVDPDGHELPPGGSGEVVVRGFNVMQGYFEDPEATAAAFDAQGRLRTGDVGHLDEGGYLRLTGRLKDMYIVGGFNVAPAEVEAVLLAHPAVRDAAVIGVPDRRLGEVGAAFVVPEAGTSVDTGELVAWCRPRLANFKVPRHVVPTLELPYNAIGKVQKGELRDRFAALGPPD
jgi:acyl-CoA synthetase (AMP-forming)/AMP-acid ligase II